MQNKYVDFISDRKFEKCAENAMRVYEKSENSHKMLSEREVLSILSHTKNATDGFKAICDIYGHGFNLDTWKQFEIDRVLNLRNNKMSVMFHLDILTSVDGWDFHEPNNNSQLNRIIKNEDNSLFIDIRNTHYSGGFKPDKTRDKLEEILRKYPEATAYRGYIISKNHKKNIDAVFQLSDREDNENIREISGDVIYEKVTGDELALSKTYSALRSYLKGNNGHKLSKKDEEVLDLYENKIFN